MESINLEQLLNLLSQEGQRLKLTLHMDSIVLSHQNSPWNSTNEDTLLFDYSLKTYEDFTNLVKIIEQKQNLSGFTVFLTRSRGFWGEYSVGISILKIHENQPSPEVISNFDLISKLDVYGTSDAFSRWYQSI